MAWIGRVDLPGHTQSPCHDPAPGFTSMPHSLHGVCRSLIRLVVWCLLGIVSQGVSLAQDAGHVTFRFGGPRHGREATEQVTISCDAISHHVFDRLLRDYVDARGMVCYSAWRATPRDVDRLCGYLLSLSHVDPNLPSQREAVMAYFINAYNALTLWGILHEYPVASIQRIDGKRTTFAIFDDVQLWSGDAYHSLNGIENDVLRPMGDFRIHFALVCAAKGCPRLRHRAYTAEQLHWQLDDNAREFFADSARFRITRFTGTVHLSPILKWYRDDFGETDCDLVRTVFRYLPPDDQAWLAAHPHWTMKYLGYNWALNDRCPTVGVALASAPYKMWSKLSPKVESLKNIGGIMRGRPTADACSAAAPSEMMGEPLMMDEQPAFDQPPPLDQPPPPLGPTPAAIESADPELLLGPPTEIGSVIIE